ncbi:MAG TPA: ABC transporter permease [Blastocatellia bacterium]|nr:ABC transporter permease [Blastocatellia bacterium]
MNNLWQDLRYGARMLSKNPSFTLIAVFTLALGIGANTAIFSVINAVILRPLAFKEPDKLVVLGRGRTPGSVSAISYPEFAEIHTQNQVFAEVAASATQEFDLAGGNEPEHINALSVSNDFFRLLGIEPMLGRTFLAEEHQVGQHPAVLISHSLWRRRFGGDPEVVGKSLLLDAESYTVVGILPPSFYYPQLGQEAKFEALTPLAPDPERSNSYLTVLARLKNGSSLAQAQADLAIIKENIARQYPGPNNEHAINAMFFQHFLVRSSRFTLMMFWAAAAFVLLIACANVANLQLARAASRQKEIATRLTLGATRVRLLRQLLTESFLLSFIGGGLGLLAALWGKDFLVYTLAGRVIRIQEVSIDGSVLAFTALVACLTGAIFGLAPALLASKPDLNQALKESQGNWTGSMRRNRLRNSLVVAEIALTFVLLAGAGLLVRSLMQLYKREPGFQTDNVLTMRLTLPRAKYATRQPVSDFFQGVTARVKALPGVEEAGLIDMLPLAGQDAKTVLNISESSPAGARIGVSVRSVSDGYFKSLGIPLLGGRNFTERDDFSAPRAVIVNDALARHLWPDGDVLGKHVSIGGPDEPLAEIVGIVGNTRSWSVTSEPRMEVYAPYLQRPRRSAYLTIRTVARTDNLIAAIRRDVLAVDKDQPVYNIKTLEQRLADSLDNWRLPMFVLSLYAGLALLLAAVGIYGVMSYSVSQRTQEIGIRLALGARPGQVLEMILKRGMALALIGVSLGTIAALALTRLMSSLLFGVGSTDPMTFISITILLAIVALFACYLPARRATKVNPMIALRSE